MQERKEIREMFEKKHKLLAKEHALKNAIQFMSIFTKEYALFDKKKPVKVIISDLVKMTIDVAKEFEAYIRGEDFIKENLEFISAGEYFAEAEAKKTETEYPKNSIQNKRFRR